MSRPPIPGLREKIISAALKVFADKGFKSATVREIARLVGVTVGVIYLHFTNKERLYVEALQEEMRQYQERIREIAREDDEAAIRHFIMNHLTYTALRKEGISLQFKDYDLEFAKPYRSAFFSYQKEFLAGIIRSGVEHGIFCVASCEHASLFILFALKGAVFNYLAGTVSLATAKDALCRSVLSFLKQDALGGEAGPAFSKIRSSPEGLAGLSHNGQVGTPQK